MAVTPVNLARVSFNMRAYNLLESMRLNTVGLNVEQTRLATGLRFLRPSEDPLRAVSAVNLENRLDRLGEVENNLAAVNATLSEVESNMQKAIDLTREAHTLAIEGVDDGITIDERKALATVANSLLDQLVAMGNSRYLNTYLFAGQQHASPFEQTLGGVLYSGDGNRRETVVDTDMSADHFTIPGQEFFNAISSRVVGAIDLDPALTADTRISDLRGAAGLGVELGRIVVVVAGQETEIDLSDAATVGDVVDQLNAEMPAGLQAAVGTRGINLTQTAVPVQVTIQDTTGGRTARDLGLLGGFSVVNRPGEDLDPRLTGLSRVSGLLAGAGIDLSRGLVVRNGANSGTIDLADAETIEDVLNRMNRPDLGVWARIADDGYRLEVLNRVSGTPLSVEENGGGVATALGIRSLYGGTLLADLNDGLGVETVDGDDIRITTADGTVIDVDLSGATTIQDVLDRMNAAGGGDINVGLVRFGNGILITDLTIGGGTLTIEALNSSPALMDLGLDVTASGNSLLGEDINPLYVDSPFTALIELRTGLESDDRHSMVRAAERLERVLEHMQTVQGELASQAKMMAGRAERVEAETSATRVLLSDVRDADFSESAVRFQQLQMALQANLGTASRVFNLSLLDYLR